MAFFSMETLYEIILIWLLIKIVFKFTNGVCMSNVCLVGKTALITGGNLGIGYQTALGLAARGCRVIIASRSSSEATREAIVKHTKNPNIIVKKLDLASFESVRKFAEDINATEDRLDILINNSGIGTSQNTFTEDGIQIEMQVNHLGPFLLTHLLTDLLKKSAPSRIIFVSSMMAFMHNLRDIESLADPFKNVDPSSRIANMRLYCNTKMCNVIASTGFAQRLKSFGVTSNSLHPGVVTTKIWAESLKGFVPSYVITWFYNICGLLMKNPFEGVQTTLRLAVSNKLETVSGEYFWDCVRFPVPNIANDADFCDKFWKESELLVKLMPDEKLS